MMNVMDKYLFPWKEWHSPWAYIREKFDGGLQCIIEFDPKFEWMCHMYDGSMISFHSLGEAMLAKDAELAGRGFVLLTEEQTAKFRSLL